MKSQGSPKVITIHAELDMSVNTKFHGNPSDSGCDILLKDTTVNLTVALEKMDSLSANHEIQFCANLPGRC